MSLLPQRKKSVEEITQLLESLGITGLPQEPVEPAPAEPEAVDRIVPTTHEATLEHLEPAVHIAADPSPPPVSHQRVVHSLKRSERMPPIPELVREPDPLPVAPEPTASAAESTRPPKRVRSLRKSEQAPIAPPKPVESQQDSLAAFHRHSEQELAEIRRQAALSVLSAPPPPNLTQAHPVLIAPGYLAPAAAAIGIWFYEIPMAATAACLGLALLIAGFIYLRNPYSRHHAAFIAISALFVAAFGALHYFPQLTFQHGP